MRGGRGFCLWWFRSGLSVGLGFSCALRSARPARARAGGRWNEKSDRPPPPKQIRHRNGGRIWSKRSSLGSTTTTIRVLALIALATATMDSTANGSAATPNPGVWSAEELMGRAGAGTSSTVTTSSQQGSVRKMSKKGVADPMDWGMPGHLTKEEVDVFVSLLLILGLVKACLELRCSPPTNTEQGQHRTLRRLASPLLTDILFAQRIRMNFPNGTMHNRYLYM